MELLTLGMYGEPVGHENPPYQNEVDRVDVERAKDRIGFDDASIRAGFVRKVFAIVTVMVLRISDQSVKRFQSKLAYLASGCGCDDDTSGCECRSTKLDDPKQLDSSFSITLSAGAMSMVACARVPPATVLLALVTTILSCSAIILFACQTKYDITRFYPPYITLLDENGGGYPTTANGPTRRSSIFDGPLKPFKRIHIEVIWGMETVQGAGNHLEGILEQIIAEVLKISAHDQ
ncbi:hypothetical protein KIN20_025927 [Parelaphostrongylus tenuis]|uniref:Uncharacterized protein n=1 Tax=Parelaphostrongylus tenuis TaxID=148309 RepID=A0AAD5N9U6_PARTN|nr:hypothetical protein KIN20_025927 [Parelaphostrongylus tenuis]